MPLLPPGTRPQFERFLNPERIGPMDVDLDFDERQRDQDCGEGKSGRPARAAQPVPQPDECPEQGRACHHRDRDHGRRGYPSTARSPAPPTSVPAGPAPGTEAARKY
ncbi:hypothetical protein ACFXJ6_23010 [Streptomyces sp. NPDC059218]|uniref:hypothetical protein n=1 Tax=unclassified Streptomyces TaxID=2593676 RepID=UPI0036C55552